MPGNPKRVTNFNLGVNMGWLQQGSAFGGRPIGEMTADLERVRTTAAQAGYTGYEAFVHAALEELHSADHAQGVINALIVLLQSQAQGADEAALNLGIALGALQQGARGNNRPISLVTADLQSARAHAAGAKYDRIYDGYIDNAFTKLSSGQAVSSILGEITALIGMFQGQL